SEIEDRNIILVLVGGYEADILLYRTMAKTLKIESRVIFIGRVEHGAVPLYLKAFDVLLAPFPQNEHYSYYMSPMKIFEYMASSRPIISTELPTIIESLG